VIFLLIGTKMSSQKRPPGRPRAFNLETSLDQAVIVFWQKGYSGASLDDLTRAMGINRPSLYASFGDKQTLFFRCVDHYSNTVGQKPFAALVDTPDIQNAILSFFNAVIETVCSVNTPKGCLIACILTACAEEIPEAREHLFAAITSSDQAVEQRFLQAIQDGQLAAEFPARSQACLTTSLMHGIALRARAGEPKSSLTAFATDVSGLVLKS
jgi:TetR/AcrR family transcriptional regulator, copper-responsive repressor